MDTSNIFCSICGHVFVHEAHAALVHGLPTSWQCQAVLLSDPAHEFDRLELHYHASKTRNAALVKPIDFASDNLGPCDVDGTAIKEEPAIYTGYDYFQLKIPGQNGGDADNDDDGDGDEREIIRVNDHVGQAAWEGGNATYRIAVHPACLAVAKDYVEAQQRRRRSFGSLNGEGVAPVASLRTLWKALRMRWEAMDAMAMVSDGSLGDTSYTVLNQHSVYELPRQGRVEVLLQRRWNPAEQADPVSITNAVARAARPFDIMSEDADPFDAKQFRNRFYSLPRELQEIVLGYLAIGNSSWALESTRMLSRSTWKHLLIDGHVLPFLGQLDRGVFGNDESDCETLIRKLCQSPSPKTGYWPELGDAVPNWLRSRRWRWELLDDMYVGDVLPRWHEWMQRESEVPAVPQYWDRDGNRVHPVTRMTDCS